MTMQLKRCWIFLVGNLGVSGAFIATLVSRAVRDSLWSADDRVWWAKFILIFILAQIVFRVLAMIVLAAQNAISGGTEQVDREDELDKLIEYRTTAFTTGVFMAFFVATIATQALALPLFWLFTALVSGMLVSGITGDIANLYHYRRGY